MCLQRVHYSVRVAFVGSVFVCSLRVLGDLLFASLAISVAVPVKIEVLRLSTVAFFPFLPVSTAVLWFAFTFLLHPLVCSDSLAFSCPSVAFS